MPRKEAMEMDRKDKYAGKQNETGGSIKVASVQALAASDPNNLKPEVLQRYLRPKIDDDLFIGDDESIPVIDMQRLLDPEFSEEEASRLKFACEEWGFFQVSLVL